MLHDLLSIIVVMMCLWAIVSPRVPTGIVATVGLCVIAVAALWSLDDWAPWDAVATTLLLGNAIAGVAGLWRCTRKPTCMMRRASDWQATAADEERPS